MLRAALFVALVVAAGCTSAGNQEKSNARPPVAEFCDLHFEASERQVAVRAVIETDGLHGMYIGSSGCSRKLRIELPDTGASANVDAFLADLRRGRGVRMDWQSHPGTYRGRIATRPEGGLSFVLIQVENYSPGVN